MSQAQVALEEEAFPHRIRWTVEECNRLVADGYLKDRYELIEGEIISKWDRTHHIFMHWD